MPHNILTHPPASLDAEIVVIGSGPGGSITACLLAEAGMDVLLVEEGAYLPQSSSLAFSKQEMEQKYRNGGITVAMGNPKVAYVEGRCVGGGSEINSALYHRTPTEILEQWRKQYDILSFEEEDLIPHFEACEQAVNVCFSPIDLPLASLKLHDGAQKLGWSSKEIPRWMKYETDDSSAVVGSRQSMTETFIPRFLKTKSHLLTNTRVIALQQESDSWKIKAQFQGNGQVRPISIFAKTVFLASGAVQTPAILRRSGIKKNIGNSLRLHATLKVVAQFNEIVNSKHMGVPAHQVKEFSPQYSFGCSISSEAHLQLALLNHQLHPQEIDASKMAVYYAMIAGGVGKVRTLPFSHDPLVSYALRKSDLYDLSDGIRQLSLLLLTAGAQKIYPQVSKFPTIEGRQDLISIPRPIQASNPNVMTIHIMASCPMGENPSNSATNSFGKVHDMDNLYLADASILGGAATVNPQGTIMALVRRNTIHYLENH